MQKTDNTLTARTPPTHHIQTPPNLSTHTHTLARAHTHTHTHTQTRTHASSSNKIYLPTCRQEEYIFNVKLKKWRNARKEPRSVLKKKFFQVGFKTNQAVASFKKIQFDDLVKNTGSYKVKRFFTVKICSDRNIFR